MILQIITIALIVVLAWEIISVKKMLKKITGIVNDYLNSIIDSENEFDKVKNVEEQNLVISRVLEEIFP